MAITQSVKAITPPSLSVNHELSPHNVPSSEELRTLLLATSNKTRGSLKYRRAWRHWSTLTITNIRYKLSQNLPHPVDYKATSDLFFNLGVAADVGEMPSFSDPGSRSGYALDFFCRARLLADLLSDTNNLPPFFAEGLETMLHGDKTCNIASIGGGPGYDFVSAALVATFQSTGNGSTVIKGTVFDYETGWHDLVEPLSCATRSALEEENHSCSWGGKCDITRSLSDPSNEDFVMAADVTDLWVCQYCVAENAGKLRDSDFVFFEDLFDAAKEGAMFVFTETTHRLWPEITDVVLRRSNGGFEVAFPRVIGRGKGGPQMVLRKKDGAKISEDQMLLCEEYRGVNDMHERKVQSGWVRARKKVRGAK